MPQLDVYSYFSVTTAVILSFLILLCILHNYILPKVVQCLKFRNKYNKYPEKILENQFLSSRILRRSQDTATTNSVNASYISEVENLLNKNTKNKK